MNGAVAASAGLSPLVVGPVCLALLALVALACRGMRSAALQFIVAALYLRFSLSAFPAFTFQSSPVGLSWNALGSITTIGVGLLVLRRRSTITGLPPFAFLLMMVVVSGLVSGNFPSIAEAVIKFVYLLTLTLAVFDALEDVGPGVVTRICLLPFALPLTLQAISVAIGRAKGTEDGSGLSYVGGYFHESAFSMMLMSGLLLTSFATRLKASYKVALFAVFTVGILLANYRTAILAMAPLLLVTIGSGVLRRFVPEQRTIVFGALLAVGGVASVGVISLAQDRFADIATVVDKGSDIIKPPTDFTNEDRAMFSGRTLIWSRYLYAYAESSDLQRIFGHGPESWVEPFGVYAHNTLVGTLYEYGLAGVFVVCLTWGWMLVLALRAGAWREVGANISYIVLNMATMPMWQIEGLILYALICAFSIYAFQTRRAGAAATAPAVPMRPLQPVRSAG